MMFSGYLRYFIFHIASFFYFYFEKFGRWINEIHPRWYLATIFGITIFTFLYIKLRYPFWNIQPVYHTYDFWRKWLSSPFVIQKTVPQKTKFCDFNNIQTGNFLNMGENVLQQISDILLSNYIPSDQILYTITPKQITEYLTGQNHSSFVSIYFDKQTIQNENEDFGKSVFEYKYLPIGCVTSRSMNVFLAPHNKNSSYTKIPCYYWDFLCIHREHRIKNLARNLIQTHEYNQRVKNPGVLVSLFKKEGVLSQGITPITEYNTYTFPLPTFKFSKLPEHIVLVPIDSTNLGDFTDFLQKGSSIFQCSILPDLGALSTLIRNRHLYVYLMKKRHHVLGVYFFKDAKMQYEEYDGCGIQCIGSIMNCNSSDVFYLGYLHSLQKATWKTAYKVVLFDELADNGLIWRFFSEVNRQFSLHKNAYYFYNFVVPSSPFSAKDCLMLI
jgi:hypothetical protein